MNVMTSPTSKVPSKKVAELLSELGEVLEQMPNVGSGTAKAMIGFLTDLALAEADPENENHVQNARAAWQEVASSDTLSLQDVALKARATVLYREGVKTWSGDTFNDDDWPYLQEIIEDAAQFAIPD
jgi:hypothetical protein